MTEMKPPILITGCARSGTSMVAGAINKCGAFGGDMSGPNHNNRKGMFENVHIRNVIVKPYLNYTGADRMGQYPLPDLSRIWIPTNWKARVEGAMKKEGYQGGPWMYKGAKMCLFWPVWHYAFPDAKWVIVRRKTDDIINSCLKTNFMRAFSRPGVQRAVGAGSESEGWRWWVQQHEARFREMIDEGLNVKVVWPERMVKGDYSQMQETIEWLGLQWSTEVMSFIDPLLWKARQKNR